MTDRMTDAVQAGMILGCGAGMAVAGSALRQRHGVLTEFGVEDLLGLGLAILGLGIVTAWFLALTLAFAIEFLTRRGRSRTALVLTRCTPALMRRIAVSLLGLNLLAAPAAAHAATAMSVPSATGIPAVVQIVSVGTGLQAGPAGSPSWRSGPAATSTMVQEQEAPVSPAWRPDPLPPNGGLLLRQETRTERQIEEVVVSAGDSLWSIVGRQLGPLATAADIAGAWPAWFEANRDVIGDDPSRLIPGQVLTAPPG